MSPASPSTTVKWDGVRPATFSTIVDRTPDSSSASATALPTRPPPRIRTWSSLPSRLWNWWSKDDRSSCVPARISTARSSILVSDFVARSRPRCMTAMIRTSPSMWSFACPSVIPTSEVVRTAASAMRVRPMDPTTWARPRVPSARLASSRPRVELSSST